MIAVNYHQEIAIVKLSRGITNALNLELIQSLRAIIRQIREDANICGLVLSSSNDKFFSIGFDIPQLFDLKQQDFEHFYTTFNQTCLDLYTLPKPTVAAITGHAVAGGCIITLCCDYRIIAEGRKLMGLNEVKLGVPIPYPADCILHDLVGTKHAHKIITSGEFFPPQESLRLGLVDRILLSEQVLPEAIQMIKSLGDSPQETFAIIKRKRVCQVEAQVLDQLEKKQRHFVDCWYSLEARQKLKEAMEKY